MSLNLILFFLTLCTPLARAFSPHTHTLSLSLSLLPSPPLSLSPSLPLSLSLSANSYFYPDNSTTRIPSDGSERVLEIKLSMWDDTANGFGFFKRDMAGQVSHIHRLY